MNIITNQQNNKFLSPMIEERIICYTLDLEPDYAGVAPFETYETLSQTVFLNRLADIVHRFSLKITIFATGKVLDQKRDSVEFFRQLGAEIELHGFHHVMYEPDIALEVQEGVDAYRKYFDKNPMGYRSPGGVITPGLFKSLARTGIKYDSSLIPSFRWGVYNNLKSPIMPFIYHSGPLLELPIGVIPTVRLLIAASHIRLLGLSKYKLLFNLFGRPSPLVYLFHLVDLIPAGMLKQLSPLLRCAYTRGKRKSLEVFEKSVKYFKAKGYRSEYMSNLYKRYSKGLPS